MFIGKTSTSTARKANAYLKQKLMPFRPIVPIASAIDLYIEYNFAFNKTEKKSVIKKGKIPHIKRPDSDNLMKGLLDVMGQCKFWNDDSQISNLHFLKTYSIDPCISIKIYTINI